MLSLTRLNACHLQGCVRSYSRSGWSVSLEYLQQERQVSDALPLQRVSREFMRGEMNMSQKIRQAFTLIELLIVVAIIGILAAIAVPNFLNAQTRAKVARVKADFKALSIAIESYHIDHNQYPYFTGYDFPRRFHSITYRLIPLTTPLAYIGSLDLQDPFLPLGTDAYEDDILRYSYNYRNYEFFEPPIKAWCLNSLGPDKAPNKGLQTEYWVRGLVPPETTVIYSPSNGLVSDGDMPMTGGQTKFQSN